MKKLLSFAAASIAACGFATAANATTFVFKSGEGPYEIPAGNFIQDCGTVGTDYCTIVDSAGFNYEEDGFNINITAYQADGADADSDRDVARLIQDIHPNNSGLGAFSAGEDPVKDDQVQIDDNNESLLITFLDGDEVKLSNIEFNGGHDGDCFPEGDEGPCGLFDIWVDGVLVGDDLPTANLVAMSWVGKTFEIFHAGPAGGGFAIGKFDINYVPIPGALPLLLSGIAGLGFAARRKKSFCLIRLATIKVKS